MSSVHVRIRVGDETYALPVARVREVAELGELAAVPSASPAVLGVRNLRGEVLPVFDLATLLDVSRDGDAVRLIVAEDEGRRAGFAIDEVKDVGELPEPDSEAECDFLVGARLANGDLVGVIDVKRLFDHLEVGRAA